MPYSAFRTQGRFLASSHRVAQSCRSGPSGSWRGGSARAWSPVFIAQGAAWGGCWLPLLVMVALPSGCRVDLPVRETLPLTDSQFTSIMLDEVCGVDLRQWDHQSHRYCGGL